jgi:hypothetical protein
VCAWKRAIRFLAKWYLVSDSSGLTRRNHYLLSKRVSIRDVSFRFEFGRRAQLLQMSDVNFLSGCFFSHFYWNVI